MSSKLRKLKQQAYEAGKKRDWSGAAEAYAQILEMDKTNPSLLNEYGDLCLKAGDISKAVRQFLSAASRYKQTGLLNNAQAVYKKVLRHDENNINAHWFLAEIRSSQGLLAEGEQHALKFLSAAEEVSGEIKEIFLKRCLELFALYACSEPILERVEGIFRIWDMPLESSRAAILRACLAHQAGRTEEAKAAVTKITSDIPELVNYAEYARWQEVTGQTSAPTGFNDFNTLDLNAQQPVPEPADAPAPTSPASLESEPAAADSETAADEAGASAAAFAEFLADGGEPETPQEGFLSIDQEADPVAVVEEPELTDEDGCISIDLETDTDTSFASLIDAAAESVEAAGKPAPATQGGSVNLLDEILAEEGEDILRSSESEQVSTIASEIGRNVGDTGDADPEAQYQQGLVYLELGLYDQAALAFSAASEDPTHAQQAREMWGHALHRDGRSEEALKVLQDGLAGESEESATALGLRYHAGRILEELGRSEEAQGHYRRIHAVDAGFADVAQRLHATIA